MRTVHLLVVLRADPHASLHAVEARDFALAALAFEQRVSLLLMGDGVGLLRPARIRPGSPARTCCRGCAPCSITVSIAWRWCRRTWPSAGSNPRRWRCRPRSWTGAGSPASWRARSLCRVLSHAASRHPSQRARGRAGRRHGRDDLVLMHAAVLGATRPCAIPPGVRVQAMGVDLAARGLDASSLAPGVAVLDDAGLVALALRHPQSLTWS
jgi:sulfur relay protein TusB/DsrH